MGEGGRYGCSLGEFAGHDSLEVAFVFTVGDGFALVVLGFAFGNGEEDFGAAVFEVELQRNKGDAFLINLAGELVDFAGMGEENAVTLWAMVEVPCGWIGGDFDLMEGQAWGFEVNGDEAFFDGGAAIADGFDFGAFEFDTDFEGVLDEVVMACPAVFVGGGVVLGFLFIFGHRWGALG